MKKSVKALLLVMCAIVLVVATVFTTLAFLQKDVSITNTFTVGNMTIDMDEADVDEYGKPLKDGVATSVDLADRVDKNTYKLIPGHTYTKDPTITIGDKSEQCYVFAMYTNEISDRTTIAIDDTDWAVLDADQFPNVYVYVGDKATQSIVDAANSPVKLDPIFSEFSTNSNAAFEDADEGKTIKVYGYAVQASGFDDALDAWTSTFNLQTPQA